MVSSAARAVRNLCTPTRRDCTGWSSSVFTSKPPHAGWPRTAANASASTAGERSEAKLPSSYAPEAITRADRHPGPSSGAGRVTGKPGSYDPILLFPAGPRDLEGIAVETDFHRAPGA